MKYRPDIDGLRAVAVLLVLAFHAFPGLITGGFIGVDIFFVISGYLITTIIYKDFANGEFSYRKFYSRRIRRIFPALGLLLAANILIGWFILFPDELQQLGKHIFGANGFVSNLILWSESGYFDNASESKPLLHLWSLGIEEQFYIIWPIILFISLRTKTNPVYPSLIFLALFFLSNIYTISRFSVSDAFYLPNNRMWELLLGCLLSILTGGKDNGQSKKRVFTENGLAVLGGGLILGALLLLDKNSSFPGWWALLPSVGACLIILSPNALLNRYLLSNRLVVYIGLISYPLYLWHWSILTFSHILGYTSNAAVSTCLLASFFLSIMTFEWGEKNIRRRKSPLVVPLLVAFSLLTALVGLGMWFGTIAPRNNSTGVKLAAEAVGDWEYPKGLQGTTINGQFFYGKTGNERNVLFFGDSLVAQYGPRLVKLIDEDPVNTSSVLFATTYGCQPIPNVYEDKHPWCNEKFRDNVIAHALSPAVDSVVIGASWDFLIKPVNPLEEKYRYYYLQGEEKHYFDEDGIEHSFREFEKLLAGLVQEKKVYLVLDNPGGENFDPKSFFSGTRLGGIVDRQEHWQQYGEKQREVRERLMTIAEPLGVILIDPLEHFCKENRCKTSLDDGTPIYKDSNHIRPFYVKEYVKYMDVTVRE